jgi:molybdate transport system substrate-binding protein
VKARVAILALLCAAAACGRGAGPPHSELVVSAAASMSDVLREAAALYHEKNPGVTVLVNFGSSGALEQQIRQGAAVDVFVSAGVKQLDALDAAGLLRPATRRAVAANELVLAVPAGRDRGMRGFSDLPGAGRVAMGAPASVPAGEYALESLRAQGLWAAVQPKVVYTTDVRQALAYVERGEVDAALVYRTDAIRGQKVRIVAVAPPGTHRPIVYPAAVPTTARNPAGAERFLAFLGSPGGQAVFQRYGFAPPPRRSES